MGKKEVILLFVVILSLPTVLAIDLNEIPIMLIIPIVLILLVIIIFAIIYIRDKFAIKSLALPTFNNIGKKEDKTTKPKTEIRKPKVDYQKKITQLEKQINYLDPYTFNKELINIIRLFFSEYLNISYQFTFEELEDEIKKKGKGITFAAQNLSKIMYGPSELSLDINKKIINEFKDVIKKVQGYTTELSVDQIKNMIKKGIDIAKKDKNTAIRIYYQIYYHYNGLPKKDKPKIYKKVIELYKLIF